MTVSELIELAGKQIDEDYDNSRYYFWFQSTLNDLLDILYMPTSIVLTLANSVALLPLDYRDAIRLYTAEGLLVPAKPMGDTTLNGYYVLDGQIHVEGLGADAVLTLIYNRYPEQITESPNQVPDIPVRYHHLFVLYSGKMAMLYEDEVAYEDRYRSYDKEYMQAKLQMKTEMDFLRARDRGKLNSWRVVRRNG